MNLFLSAIRRNILGKQTKNLRRKGEIPAVMYGHGTTTVTLSISEIPFQKIWNAAGESTLIDLRVDTDQPVKAIIQDVQCEPASGKILHVDFHQVNMKEKVEVDVAITFGGESPAVKELGGTLVKDHDTITVECLPQDLVKEIPVSLSVLKTFDEVLRARDLVLPKGLTLLSNPDDIVARVEAPRTEAELAELDQAVEEDVTKVEKVEKPKTEEDEGTEEKPPSQA